MPVDARQSLLAWKVLGLLGQPLRQGGASSALLQALGERTLSFGQSFFRRARSQGREALGQKGIGVSHWCALGNGSERLTQWLGQRIGSACHGQ